MDYELLLASIRGHEGLSLTPIADAHGSISIGYGRNLTFTGITALEAEALMEHDVADRTVALQNAWPPFGSCDGPRQRVLIEMAYQLGTPGLLLFKNMLHAIAVKDYETAAQHVEQSQLAKQTPARAKDYAALLRTSA